MKPRSNQRIRFVCFIFEIRKRFAKKKHDEGKEQDNMGLLVGFPIEKIKSCLSLKNFGVPRKK